MANNSNEKTLNISGWQELIRQYQKEVGYCNYKDDVEWRFNRICSESKTQVLKKKKIGLMTNIGCVGDFGKVAGFFTIYTY